MKNLIIAEAGVNHNGDIAIACALIDAAADAGADLVKFQTFKAERLVVGTAQKAVYQAKTTDADESQFEMLKHLELRATMHEQLIDHAARRGIEFFSTDFDLDSLDYLMKLGMARIKVPSGEITNLPYLRKVGSYGRQVILSTGMANLGEIEAALLVLEQAGTPRSHITVLQCTTEYPAPMDEVNLRAMLTIRDAFGVAVGYSDHTRGIEVPIAAVALGATVIEKHFTLDQSLPGPDHQASLDPAELRAMIAAIRNIEVALGDGIKRPSPSEIKNKPLSRKSIVAQRPIRTGESFSPENLAVKRPGYGISPMHWDAVIGQRARRDFLADEPIEL